MKALISKLDELFTSRNYSKRVAEHPDLMLAYYKTYMLTSKLVFMVARATPGQYPAQHLIREAKAWCEGKTGANFITGQAGLQLIILHEGEITPNEIQNLYDKTGFHSSICQSITLIDLRTHNVDVSRNWLIWSNGGKLLKKIQLEVPKLPVGVDQ